MTQAPARHILLINQVNTIDHLWKFKELTTRFVALQKLFRVRNQYFARL